MQSTLRSFDLAHLAHLELLTPKPDESLHFFVNVMGMTESGRRGESVYLRGWDDYEHHTLKLTASKAAGMGHFAFRATSPEALQRRVGVIERSGLGRGWTVGDLGHGPAYSFTTSDGRTTATPGAPEDPVVLAMFNRHQLFDNGFGPALGMTAADAAEAAFEAHGYEIRIATSDWLIGRADHALQLALLDGWLGAALEIAPESRLALTSWHQRRRAHVLAGRSELRVGHVDLVGWL